MYENPGAKEWPSPAADTSRHACVDVQRGHFADKGWFRRGRAYFLVQKLRNFRNLRCVRADNSGIEPVRTFCRQGGGGQFFTILCGCQMWTAPYLKFSSSEMPIYSTFYLGLRIWRLLSSVHQ